MMKFNKPTVIVCGINADKIPFEEEKEITVRKCEKEEIPDLMNLIRNEMLIISEDVFRENKEAVVSANCKDNVVIIATKQVDYEIKTVASVEETRETIFAMISGEKEQTEVFRRATEILNEFCITSNLKGKTYLRQAICAVVRDESLIRSMIKGLYTYVAKEFDVTVSKTERCMRFAVHTGWERSASEVKVKYFGSLASFRAVPTNAEFIANIAEYIRYEI